MTKQHEQIAELLLSIGWRSSNDAQWENLRDALPKLAALASLAPAAVDQRIDAWHAVWERISKHSPAFAWPHSTGQEAVLAWIDGQAAQVAALTAQCEANKKNADAWKWLVGDGHGADGKVYAVIGLNDEGKHPDEIEGLELADIAEKAIAAGNSV